MRKLLLFLLFGGIFISSGCKKDKSIPERGYVLYQDNRYPLHNIFSSPVGSVPPPGAIDVIYSHQLRFTSSDGKNQIYITATNSERSITSGEYIVTGYSVSLSENGIQASFTLATEDVGITPLANRADIMISDNNKIKITNGSGENYLEINWEG